MSSIPVSKARIWWIPTYNDCNVFNIGYVYATCQLRIPNTGFHERGGGNVCLTKCVDDLGIYDW